MNDVQPLHVLMVEDSEDDALLLRRQLEAAGYDVALERVDTQETLAQALGSKSWDIVFSDFSMPRFDGLQALKTVREVDPDVPFIIVSGTIGEERAVQLMKSGAQDYVLKGHIKRLVPAIERELKEARMRRAHRRAQQHIQHLAYYDPLTGLFNRARFLEQLAQQIEAQAAGSRPLTVLAVELSYYDEINMTLGYSVGDALLCHAAERLQRASAQISTLAALGTARFAAILFPGGPDDARLAAERIQKEFNQVFDIAGFRLSTGLNIGTARYPDHGSDAQLLVRRAELALVLSRRTTSGYADYSLERDPSNSQNFALATDLREAIDGRHLQLHFQPKIDLASGRFVGVEAFSRWEHARHGVIPPDRFVPLAEKAGLINSLTLWLLEAAVAQYRAWKARGLDVPIAVNLSVRNLTDHRLLRRFQTLVIEQQLPPEAIAVEITESALMEDPENSLETLHILHDMGIRIYVDDFGTGYSSLSYLKQLPIDAIKIDKSFVLDMQRESRSASIVRWTIELAHNLGLQVVAEGVDNPVTLQDLKTLGCDVAQGFFIGHPLPPAEFLDWHEHYGAKDKH